MSAIKKLILDNGPKRIKDNQRYFNNVRRNNENYLSDSGTFPDNPHRGLLFVPTITKKPKNARHLVMMLLHGLQSLKLADHYRASSVGNVYLVSEGSHSFINENNTANHTNSGKLRSFDDLVAMVNSYFPKVHYLKIFEYYATTVMTRLNRYSIDGGYKMMMYHLYPNFASCSTMGRIRCTFNSHNSHLVDDISTLKTYDSRAVIEQKEYFKLLKLGLERPTNKSTFKSLLRSGLNNGSTSRHQSIYTWNELASQYQAKYGVNITTLEPVVLTIKDFSYYFKD